MMADTTNETGGWLATLPTTNTRILVTLAVFIATAGVYLWRGVPGGIGGAAGWNSWLIFVAVMAGIDASQYIGKRFSDWTYAAAKNGPAPTVNVTAPAAATGVAVAGDAQLETTPRLADNAGIRFAAPSSRMAAALEIPARGAGDVDALNARARTVAESLEPGEILARADLPDVAHTRGDDVEHSER